MLCKAVILDILCSGWKSLSVDASGELRCQNADCTAESGDCAEMGQESKSALFSSRGQRGG